MKFIIFHGSFGGPDENWFPDVKKNLEKIGQEVIVPQFPVESWDEMTKSGKEYVPKHQTLTNWLSVFEPIAKSIKPDEKYCWVGHSIGPLFMLHILTRFHIHLDSAIFVSPFLTMLKRSWQIDTVNESFYKSDFDFGKLKKLIPVSYAIYSQNDPYVSMEYPREFAKKMNSSVIESKNGGHFNSEAGYTSFPLVVELCKTRMN